MDERSHAEAHLRAIRHLMERATIYRAISSPSALIAGLLSVVAALPVILRPDFRPTPQIFILIWVGVFILTATANAWFLWQAAKKRQEPFISSGMKLALHSMLAPVVSGVGFTILLSDGYSVILIWMIFYGLALLATQHFSPRSILCLGWAFLLSGLLGSYWILHQGLDARSAASALVGTFGLFHLIYAGLTWSRTDATLR